MLPHPITIDPLSSKPKYRQLVDAVIGAIENGLWKPGFQLPSVNETADQNNLARMTVVKAYDELRRMGIVASQHGKGYYITNAAVKSDLNLFVLFDALNAYKEALYFALRDALPDSARMHIFFHHNNRFLFDNLITSSIGRYTHYIVMPHFNEDVSGTLERIPTQQLMLLDCPVPNLKHHVSSVCQNFEADIRNGLNEGLHLLRKYSRLSLICPSTSLAYVPTGRIKGFVRFCKESQIPYQVLNGFESDQLIHGEAYVFSHSEEHDLVRFIKVCKERNWVLGKDIGLVSYDDTPFKEIIDVGITVISTDFEEMGRIAAGLLIEKRREQIHNTSRLIIRGSL